VIAAFDFRQSEVYFKYEVFPIFVAASASVSFYEDFVQGAELFNLISVCRNTAGSTDENDAEKNLHIGTNTFQAKTYINKGRFYPSALHRRKHS
jgi:hypothetical protein